MAFDNNLAVFVANKIKVPGYYLQKAM